MPKLKRRPKLKPKLRNRAKERLEAKARVARARELHAAALGARREAREKFLEEPWIRVLATPLPRWVLGVVHVVLILLALSFFAGVIPFVVAEEWAAAGLCAGVALGLWLLDVFMVGWK